jgi:alpha-glucosidase
MPNFLKRDAWWRDAVIYQIYPRSFRDSNGDGEGDLKGITEGLPYLASLGIDAIWLSPIYRSPNNDGFYDVADPRDIDPLFGTLADAELLIKEAHEAGLKVIFDIIPNHFSSSHVWFQAALDSAPGSAERARFHFYDGRGENGELPPNNWNSLFTGSAWTRVPDGQWYLHLFDSSQPDLNWDNLEVHADFEKTIRFWLDRGIDGFRIDVSHGLVKENILEDHRDPDLLTKALRIDTSDVTAEQRADLLSDMPFFDRDGVHEIYRAWRKIFDEYKNRMTVGEAFVYPTSRLANYVRPDELHQIFNFDFLLIEWDAEKIKEAASRVMAELATVGAAPTWALNNHDSPRLVSRLGSSDKARALALLTAALPGSLYIYQGEELGLPDGDMPMSARKDPIAIRSQGADLGRDGCRVPLPWSSDEPNFGFTSGKPWLPQMASYSDYAIDKEVADSHSSLAFYKKTLEIRKNHPALGGEGSVRFLASKWGVVAFSRVPGFVVVANTNDDRVVMEVEATSVLHQSGAGVGLAAGVLTLPAHTTVWLQR